MAGKFFCQVRNNCVILHFEGHATGEVSWQRADEIYRRLKEASRFVCTEAHVKFLLDGSELHLVMQPAVLWDIARAIYQVARKAEEFEKAEQIALDAGLLIRSGAAVGLSNHPKIQEMAVQAAVYDRILRGAMAMKGIPGEGLFGTPSIVRGSHG